MPTYFKVLYDGEASGPFVGDTKNFNELTWAGGGRGQIVSVFDDGLTGKLHVALIAGPLPSDNDVLTQSTTTANADGDATELLYPAYMREDSSVTPNASEFDVRWTGPIAPVVGPTIGQIPTHSIYFDAQGADFVAGEIVTFGGGAVAVVIDIPDQVGTTGELELRFTTNIDAGLPVDGETITGDIAGTATVQGECHPRSYRPLEVHRRLSDLNDDPQFEGDDQIYSLDATPSAKDTDQIIRLIGGANVDDTFMTHIYGGSIAQNAGPDGDSKYSGLDLNVTTPNADSVPVLIQYDEATGLDVILDDYYENAWNPDSIAGRIRIMVKTRANGVDIDGRRIKGKLLEYGDNYFEGGTTLGDATTSLALFSSPDGNNTTSIDTVKSYLSTITEGYQPITYGSTTGQFSARLNFGGQTSNEAYQYTKWIQSRQKTTAPAQPNLFGRDGRLVTGVNRNFAFDTQSGVFAENTIIAWGSEIAFTGQTTNFQLGEVVTFSGGGRARIYAINDGGATGDIIIGDFEGPFPIATETITGEASGGNGTVDVGPVQNASFGIGLLIAFDDTGDNMYYQQLAGIDPVNNQRIWDRASTSTVLVNGGVSTRTINNQFIGLYTGTNFQTNFGNGINSSDAILGDLNRDLLGAEIGVPNNQQGEVTGLVIGDRLTIYEWDGVTTDANGDPVPNFDQMTLTTTLNGVGETTVQVNAIPENTPSTGWLRIELDSGIRRLVPYTAFDDVLDQFTIPATDFSGDPATSTNTPDVAIGYIDKTVTSPTESYTAIKGVGNTQVVVKVTRGDNQPIVPNIQTPTFGNNGFSVGAQRLDDS